MTPLRIFIGYDPRQPVSYTVLHTSILLTATRPVAITPLDIKTLPIKRMGLTPFTYSRFLVPWLCGFEGQAVFMDIDMLVMRDITELPKCIKESEAVAVPQHPEHQYEWAAMMLFNCAHPDNRVLTPEYVDDPAQCRSPHLIKRDQGGWTDRIGSLPLEWNHLVGYDEPNPEPALVHYTQGVPAFPETKMCEHAEVWHKVRRTSMSTMPWAKMMGTSVHTKKLADGQVVPKLYPEEAV